MGGTIQMKQLEQAVRFLEKDPLLHIDMLECIRRGNAECLYVSETGVLLRDQPSGTCQLSVETEGALRECLPLLQGTDLLVCHQDFYREFLSTALNLSFGERCYQAAYLKSEAPHPNREAGWDIHSLDESALPFVHQHYKMVTDEDYLLQRLHSGEMYGIFVEGKPAGFIGMHAEGSLGMVEILPEDQRRGLAFVLESYAIYRIKEKGWTPYGQVIVGNLASMHLQQKIGMTFSEKTCYWLS